MPDTYVHFSGRVKEELPGELLVRLSDELPILFCGLDPARVPEEIYVPRIFTGHTPEYDIKIVLAVEVRYSEAYQRHIVKLGRMSEVEGDFAGWQECTEGRMVASRIFTPVRKYRLTDERCGVVYHDAFTLYGPDDSGQPKPLEEVIHQAVLHDGPDPLSTERAIAQVFTDLGLWFFPRATVDPARAFEFYAGHLRMRQTDAPAANVLTRWLERPDRRSLRRQAVWVLAGRDLPDADPVEKPARYLDPVEYIRWALSEPTGKRLPATLIGRSHGDLHGRNILVGVRRGEVEYPSVFDYADMTAHNVLAWDFAKLETELKVRILPAVLRDPEALRWLLNKSRLRPVPHAEQRPTPVGVPSEAALAADRLAAFLAFEELLDALTKSLYQVEDAELIRPIDPVPTGNRKLDRLAAILLRVRKEAALWLGFREHKRRSLWKDELYLALAVYGLLNVRWDYSLPEQEAALVSAGVAVAGMPSTPELLRSTMGEGATAAGPLPSYRLQLAAAHAYWKNGDFQAGVEFVERVVLRTTTRARSAGDPPELNFTVRAEVWHAMPLIGEAALLAIETGKLKPAEQLLEDFRPLAKEFRDYEMLGRIGRLFKDAGDRKWESGAVPFDEFTSKAHPGYQMYLKAFVIYEEAFLATGNWYPGINAATLALLTQDLVKASRYAEQVGTICSTLHDHELRDRFWLFATEGEAAIIRGEPTQTAVEFYQSALNELSPGQWGMAKSSYKQACRLWKALGEERVGPVLQLFETSDLRDALPWRFLGRPFSGASA